VTDLATRSGTPAPTCSDLRGPLVHGEPWPLSAAYGTEPEADWGPREVLAHVNEMLPYWTAQLEGVLAGDPGSPVPFGRIATDPDRLGRIDADRRQTAGWLLDAIDAGLVTAGSFAGGLSAADLERTGLHPTRGELTIGDSIDRFLVTHLEEHFVQLREILARREG
jgi:hypothetical protein